MSHLIIPLKQTNSEKSLELYLFVLQNMTARKNYTP